jgi:diguanylate cyclase (GGDEF)-like protein
LINLRNFLRQPLPNWLDKLTQPLMLPVFLLAFTFLAAPYFAYLPVSMSGVFEAGPYWALVITLVLAVAFNRSKVTLFCLVLAAGFGVYQQLDLQAPLWQLLVYALVPINIAIISCYQERGLFTVPGYLRLTVLALQGSLLAWIAHNDLHQLDDYLGGGLQALLTQLGVASAALMDLSSRLDARLDPLTQLECIILLAASITITISSWRINSPVSYALFGAAAGYYLMILTQPDAPLAAANMLTSGLMLCIGLLRDSYNMAYRDELTGLPQRRAMNEQLMALGNRYCLAMLDVDHFKKFNDTHGHDVGDQVLQMVATQIRKVRGGGKAFRYGGEEFAVVFTGKDKEEAAHYLELVRKSIADYEMVIRDDERVEDSNSTNKNVDKKADKKAKGNRQKGSYRKASKKVSVTISIGVAEYQRRGQTPEEVLKLADEALYRAKDGGRNQVAIAD